MPDSPGNLTAEEAANRTLGLLRSGHAEDARQASEIVLSACRQSDGQRLWRLIAPAAGACLFLEALRQMVFAAGGERRRRRGVALRQR